MDYPGAGLFFCGQFPDGGRLRLRLWRHALPHGIRADVRALLPLPLVQRETGSGFALNAMIEADRVTLLRGAPELVDTPSESGRGQKIARCPHCRVALWSHYGGAGEAVSFVRVGTLDHPDRVPPDIHIFTESKQPWVIIPDGGTAVPQYYRAKEVWPAESQTRWRAYLGKG